jgi:hypothetical protein
MKRYASVLFAVLAMAGLYAVASLPASAQGGPPTRTRDMRSRGGGDEQSFPAQSSVAAKGAFSTIPGSSKPVKKALKASDLAGATKLVGKNGSFTGTVSQVYSPDNHGIAILDFAKDYKSAMTAIVKPANYSKLPNLDSLVGKTVLISGKFISYDGKPEIEITSVKQVKSVK